MNPLTADSTVVAKMIQSDAVWQSLKGGPIKTVEIKSVTHEKSAPIVDQYEIEIVTKKVEGDATRPHGETALFRVTASWDFMALKDVKIEKISVKSNSL